MTKEFLNLRAEIDLNFLDIHPGNVVQLGWKIEEPLIIILDITEFKLLNTPVESL